MKLWKLYYKSPKWCDKRFKWHWVPDQIDGMLYAGITIFGHSIIYSDY